MLVVRLILWQSRVGTCHEPFGQLSPLLATAIRLATVCSLWRTAVVDACRSLPSFDVRPHRNLNSLYLTSLLAELVSGGRRIILDSSSLVTAPSLPAFLQIAQPAELQASGIEDGSLSEAIGRCTSLVELQCSYFCPTSIPASLRVLSLEADYRGGVNALLRSLQGHSKLAELTLSCSMCDELPEHLPHLPSLRELSVNISVYPGETPCNLQILHDAAAQGIGLRLDVYLSDHDWCWDEAWSMQGFWSGLAGLPTLSQLHLSHDFTYGTEELWLPAELDLVSSVTCRELYLQTGLWAPITGELQQRITCNAVFSHHRAYLESITLLWSWLTSNPGVHVLAAGCGHSVTVSGCSATLPEFVQPWALVLHDAATASSVNGLPLSDFEPGLHGSLVWRNSAANDAYIEAAYSRLWWVGRPDRWTL